MNSDTVPLRIDRLADGEFVVQFPLCADAFDVEVIVFGPDANGVSPQVVYTTSEPTTEYRTVEILVSGDTLRTGEMTDGLVLSVKSSVPFAPDAAVPEDVMGIRVRQGAAEGGTWMADLDWDSSDSFLLTGTHEPPVTLHTSISPDAIVDLSIWCGG